MRASVLFLILLMTACGRRGSDAKKPTETPDPLLAKVQQAQAEVQKLIDETNGKNVDTSVDQMDGKRNFTLALKASDGDGMLFFRCSSPRDLQSYISFDEMLYTNDERRSPIRLKLDAGKPSSDWWRTSDDYKIVVVPSALRLAKQIATAWEMKIEHVEFHGPTRIATFTLAGLHEGLPKLESACRIK